MPSSPETRYAKSGDLHIAYQVVGDGPFDLLHIPGFVSNVEAMWDEPLLARFLRRLASFSRLILFDKRGTGLSDRVPNDRLPTLEERMDDLRAVLDAAGSEQAALLSHSEGGNLAVLYAATYPERTRALVTTGMFAARISRPRSPSVRRTACAHAIARAGPSKLAKTPSPAVSISRPRNLAISDRTAAWWRAISSRQARSPSCAARSVEPTMSVNSTVARIRSGSWRPPTPVTNRSVSRIVCSCTSSSST